MLERRPLRICVICLHKTRSLQDNREGEKEEKGDRPGVGELKQVGEFSQIGLQKAGWRRNRCRIHTRTCVHALTHARLEKQVLVSCKTLINCWHQIQIAKNYDKIISKGNNQFHNCVLFIFLKNNSNNINIL